MTTIRAFIAVQLPDEVKDALGEVQRALKSRVSPSAVRWVRPEQMHLTLFFLGDTDTDKLPSVRDAMDVVATSHAPFVMRLGGVGCFPNARRPRVVWVGLAEEEAQLVSLKAALDASLAPLDWTPDDKPFRAHLTLGRVKDERGVQGVDWATDVARLSVPITTLHLIESKLRPDGPTYTNRYSCRLTAVE